MSAVPPQRAEYRPPPTTHTESRTARTQLRQPIPLRRQGVHRLRQRKPARLRSQAPRPISNPALHNHGSPLWKHARTKSLRLLRRKPRDGY